MRERELDLWSLGQGGSAGSLIAGLLMERKSGMASRRWYEKYLPFIAKSPEMQVEWLRVMLGKLRDSAGVERTGVLSREEIKPYVRLLLEGNEVGRELQDEDELSRNKLAGLLVGLGEDNLQLLMECADIYEVPALIGLLPSCSRELAFAALMKTPPPYEKNPLLIYDRVFQAIREKSAELLEEAAEGVLTSSEAPDDFAANYERFKEIMLDEHILSLLYPKAR